MPSEKELAKLFDAARAATPPLDETLARRVLDDARAELGRRRKARIAAYLFGSWRLATGFATGLAATTVLGVWLGFAGTITVIDQVTASVLPIAVADELDDPFAGLDDDLFGGDNG